MRWKGRITSSIVTLLVGVAVVLVAGCERSVIEGMVVDVKGEALPGVAVGLVNGEAQGVTDACGRYKLAFEPGALEIEFIKTGYTPGRLDLRVHEARLVDAATVVLWPLPLSKGVYLFEGYRYRQMEAAEPQPYRTNEHDVVHGIERAPELETQNRTPLILCYKMPHYDVHFCRLEQVEAASFQSPDLMYAQRVWVRAESLPVVIDPIDEPEASLIELRLSRPLDPGVYAVHWDALDGYTTTDPRAFLFSLTEPQGETAG